MCMATHLEIKEQIRLPTVVVDGTRLELYVARFRMLHVKIEDNNIALEVMSHLHHIVKRCRNHPLDTLL